MTPIRALIADDQPMARERLLDLLGEQPDVQVVAVCANGAEAITAIESHQPDLVFLDMQMPEVDGLAVIEAVGPDRMPLVVFATAYDQFAIRAFEVHALDYLLKPFGRQRFEQALTRAREHLDRAHAGELADRLLALVREARPARERLVVRSGGRIVFLDPTEVDWIEAEQNYMRLHIGAESHLVRVTMQAMEQRLGEQFVRIHRSRLVNVKRVSELRLTSGGEYQAVLHGGTTLGVSRLYRETLQERLKRA